MDAPVFCRGDGARLVYSDSVDARIRVAEAQEHGWAVEGLAIVEHGRCPSCGQVYETISRQIPIESKRFACPKCASSQQLMCTVSRVAERDEAFEFAAEITCVTCKRRDRFKTVLRRLIDVLSIEIGPSGVSFSKK